MGPQQHASQPLRPFLHQPINQSVDRCRYRGQCQPHYALDRLTFYADEQTAAAGFRSRCCPTTAASSTHPSQPAARVPV